MNASEIKAKIERVEKNSFIPAHLKPAKIAKLKEELAALEKESKPAPAKKSDKKPKKQKPASKKVKTEDDFELGTPAIRINPNSGKEEAGEVIMNKEVHSHGGVKWEPGNLKGILLYPNENYSGPDRIFYVPTDWSKIKSFYEANSEKAEKNKKKAPAKKKVKTVYKAAGKDLGEVDCDELEKQFKARKEKAAKAEKKSKTRPVIEKITSNVATATKQAIESVAVEDIKKDPKKFIKAAEKAEASAEEFIKDLKTLLGDEFDSSEVSAGMKKVQDLIKDLKNKYAK